MPARTGQDYIRGLREQRPAVWICGERVEDVTTHPALRNGARSVAALYDMQHDPNLKDEMTYVSPSSGEPVGLSLIIPRTRQDLERRGTMMAHWARTTCGMMGRSPDFMNVNLAAWAAAADYFGQNRPEFKTNVVRYYEYIREHDLTLTHALINLQRSRPAAELFHLSEETALHVVRETDAGLVLRGARVLATLGPLAEEIAIYSPRMRRMKPEEERRYALAFAIPCGTPGLRFLCRESFDLGRSHFDHPLGSRFEEMDCIVFFDDVLVPWERVFLLGDVERLNEMMNATHMTIHTGHQGGAKNVAKCEFLLGVALLMAHTLGSSQQPQVQERLAELMVHTEVLKACLRAAEADAQLDRWGVMCPAALPLEAIRTLFMNVYPRMVEILQLLGSSSFMLIPSDADFQGPLAPEIERYLATDTAIARERVKLFRLAWDITGSAFGSRQVLYERFFAGDPLSRAQSFHKLYPKEGLMERIREFLGREDHA